MRGLSNLNRRLAVPFWLVYSLALLTSRILFCVFFSFLYIQSTSYLLFNASMIMFFMLSGATEPGHHPEPKSVYGPQHCWLLANILLPKGGCEYRMINIKAYLLDNQKNEIFFVLSDRTIQLLIKHHREHYATKEHGRFAATIREFCYSAPRSILNEQEEDGSGQLPCESSERVRDQIMHLFCRGYD